ncbi:PulJ/GspJ family protein [Spirilliplanes yamanashiensis]|uniref:Prepilin-type N-terminal cleavage/methylation domain-containing protein n=1 Tax=Spirilliplanes yamanashiensis TaxID=42233 RepID=A0A8J3YCN9_9ACTN|nr:hypothetical protein [Spirilliplanes yamanashiensis]MDP9816612.1 type II secretory pathway pseudopilin PulG [Spirilliplanes yamanashiensis]GIJ06138.1 hypothetical protein Sya03_54900 [Spirilliplanes yamanashiensis]
MRARRAGGDEGTTMIELVVALTVFGAVSALVTAGVLQAHAAANRTEAVAAADTQVETAFRRIDKEIRYARWIRPPAQTPSSAWVEFLNSDPATGQPRCHRVVVDRAAGVLRTVAWQPGATPPAAQSLAGQLVDGSDPFFTLEATGATDFARLRLRLTSRVGRNASAGTVTSDVTFTALNTSRSATPGAECTEGRPA